MIGRIRGEVIEVEAHAIVVDLQGLGYVLTVAMGGVFQVGEQVDLHVHTHVREDTLQLFGFRSPIEREVFNLLTTVPSIGPAKAINIMATPIEEIVQLVGQGDIKGLNKLPGVGKKTAERMLVDLKDKFKKLGIEGASSLPAAVPTQSPVANDLLSALKHLGFKPMACEHAARQAAAELGEAGDFDALFRLSLHYLRTP
jgi:Holliday junction DNA helicase RuvA